MTSKTHRHTYESLRGVEKRLVRLQWITIGTAGLVLLLLVS